MNNEQAPWQRLGSSLKLGLRACSESDWLPYDDLFGDGLARARQLSLKQQLSAERHSDVFAAVPDTQAAGQEVLEMVCTHLATHHKTPAGDPDISAHPLDAAARLVPEDLLLLAPQERITDAQGGDYGWHLVAASLCFPAHWVLADKMTKPLTDIHAPVPHYQERLAAPMDRFFTHMQVGPISARMNWSLQFGDTLYTPHRSAHIPAGTVKACEHLYARMEHQTLRKLPQTGHILFTIRTHIVPVLHWKETPNAIRDLLALMDGMSAETRAYKGVDLYRDALQHCLVSV
jgi:hypothetical protein